MVFQIILSCFHDIVRSFLDELITLVVWIHLVHVFNYLVWIYIKQASYFKYSVTRTKMLHSHLACKNIELSSIIQLCSLLKFLVRSSLIPSRLWFSVHAQYKQYVPHKYIVPPCRIIFSDLASYAFIPLERYIGSFRWVVHIRLHVSLMWCYVDYQQLRLSDFIVLDEVFSLIPIFNLRIICTWSLNPIQFIRIMFSSPFA